MNKVWILFPIVTFAFGFVGARPEPVAIDKENKLVWQDEPYTQTEKDAYMYEMPKRRVGNFAYAKAYCENLSLGGYEGWKLPTKEMLVKLYSGKKILKNIAQNYYWSSSAVTSKPMHVWTVDDTGSTSHAHIQGFDYIRCVKEIK